MPEKLGSSCVVRGAELPQFSFFITVELADFLAQPLIQVPLLLLLK
jgi:hypothetical protein